MTDASLLAAAVDPDGRRVELALERWEHIVSRHPELAERQEEIMQAIVSPTRRLPGRTVAQEWFYLRVIGPSRWLKVIVEFDYDVGRIVTAFPRRGLP